MGRAKGKSAPQEAEKAPAAVVAEPKPAAAKRTDPDEEVFLRRATELKEEGNKYYNTRDMRRALALYEQALNLIPAGHPDRIALHNNRAAAHLMLRQFLDVVKECNTVLQSVPDHPKALLRRAKAYDGAGEYVKALRDVEALQASGGDAGEDISGLKEKLKTLSDPNAKPALPIVPAEAPKAKASEANGSEEAGPPIPRPVFTWAKFILGDDLRMVPLSSDAGLNDLRTAIARKFIEEPRQAQLKILLPGGDAPTELTSDEEVAAALGAAVAAGKVARFLLERPEKPAPIEGELEEWILDFASLFREHLGIDAEAHLDQHQEGLDLCNQALDNSVSQDKANQLLASASSKFQEAAALAMYNWGNVDMCSARKRMEQKPPGGEGAAAASPAAAPPPLPAAAAAAASALLESAEKRYGEALRIKPDFHDAAISLAQHAYEKARLLSSSGGSEAAAEALFAKADSEFKRIVGSVLVDEPPAPPPAEGQEPEPSIKAQVRVMHGNVLFEHSQIRARAGKDWKALLEAAVCLFHEAGCNKADIDAALAQHAGKVAEAAA